MMFEWGIIYIHPIRFSEDSLYLLFIFLNYDDTYKYFLLEEWFRSTVETTYSGIIVLSQAEIFLCFKQTVRITR